MKTTATLIKITALLTATLLTACAGSAGPVGALGQTHARTVAATPSASSTATDRYYDPASQNWVFANN